MRPKKCCTIHGCEKTRFGGGLCNKHYARKRRTGSPHKLTQQRPVINLDTRTTYFSIAHAAAAHNVSRPAISRCCRGKQGRSAGYRWAYCDRLRNKIP